MEIGKFALKWIKASAIKNLVESNNIKLELPSDEKISLINLMEQLYF